MTPMRRKLLVLAFIGAALLAVQPAVAVVQIAATNQDTDAGVSMTIEGLVRDVACPMQNRESTATHFNLKCVRACIRTGSPIIILTKTNEIYFPTTDQMPDRSVRQKLVPYAGKFVQVKGTVYRRNGTRTIVIRDIHELKNVKLDTKLGDD